MWVHGCQTQNLRKLIYQRVSFSIDTQIALHVRRRSTQRSRGTGAWLVQRTQRLPSTMVSPRANWDACGDTFYRKIKLYEDIFDKDLELENYVVAGAPFGGAVGTFTQPWSPSCADVSQALYRDEEKIHSYKGNQAIKSSIDLYTCAGKSIRQIKVRGHPLPRLLWKRRLMGLVG